MTEVKIFKTTQQIDNKKVHINSKIVQCNGNGDCNSSIEIRKCKCNGNLFVVSSWCIEEGTIGKGCYSSKYVEIR